MSISEFERDLNGYYERLRNQELNSKLGDASATMRETLLLCAVQEELTGEPIEPSDQAKELVQKTRSAWNSNDFTRLEQLIGDLNSVLEDQRNSIMGNIQGEKHTLRSHLRGLKALNERVDRVDKERIRQLESEIKALDGVSYRPDHTYEEQEAIIRNLVREDVVDEFELIEKELMDPFEGTEIQDHVRDLIDGESLSLSIVGDTDISNLRDSELGPYLRLKLEGE